MQPDEELKNLVLRHYGKFTTGGQSETIHEMYSLQDGVFIIGAERGNPGIYGCHIHQPENRSYLCYCNSYNGPW